MKKRPFLLSLLLILACLPTACGHTAPNETTIKMEAMRFLQDEISVTAGQPVTLRLVNQDGYAHAFDIDEFDIHTPLAANETMDVVFVPDKPGRYTFYCGSPGHQAAGMVGALIVEPKLSGAAHHKSAPQNGDNDVSLVSLFTRRRHPRVYANSWRVGQHCLCFAAKVQPRTGARPARIVGQFI